MWGHPGLFPDVLHASDRKLHMHTHILIPWSIFLTLIEEKGREPTGHLCLWVSVFCLASNSNCLLMCFQLFMVEIHSADYILWVLPFSLTFFEEIIMTLIVVSLRDGLF